MLDEMGGGRGMALSEPGEFWWLSEKNTFVEPARAATDGTCLQNAFNVKLRRTSSCVQIVQPNSR